MAIPLDINELTEVMVMPIAIVLVVSGILKSEIGIVDGVNATHALPIVKILIIAVDSSVSAIVELDLVSKVAHCDGIKSEDVVVAKVGDASCPHVDGLIPIVDHMAA